jgi:cation-transporting ATPase 13A2
LEDGVSPMDNLEREDFENNLDFLGFMIFENRLKPATTGVIKKLNDANIKTVMLTGKCY